MDDTTPRVSVCIPTYNHAHFLKDAIGSVLSQTFRDLELVVVDNCSTDGTDRLVADISRADSRVRYVRNQLNVGAQNNLNRCIEVARGTYVNILCADDLLAATAIERLVAAIEQRPGIVLAGCGRVMVDSTLRPLQLLAYDWTDRIDDGRRATRRCLRNGNLIGEPSAVLFRRNDAIRGFDTRYRQLIDLEMWLYLLGKGAFAFVAEGLALFRRHEGQQTGGNVRTMSFIDDGKLVLREYLGGKDAASVLLRHQWRMEAAFDVWALLFKGAAFGEVHRRLHGVYPLPLFYLCWPMKALSKAVRIVRGRRALRR